jgi:two-component system sensor histidine kinase YesM
MKFFKKKFVRLSNKLALKIPLAYFVVILLTVTLSSTVLGKIAFDSAQRNVSKAAVKTITSIRTNVDFMIENIDTYSKIMLSNNDLQNLLRKGDIYSNLQQQAKVSTYFYNLMEAEPVIDSVYIFDNSNNCFSVGQQFSPTYTKKNVRSAPWYQDAVKKNGAFLLSLNGGGAFSNSKEQNFVSFIRVIRDVNNGITLGVMVINIPEKAIMQSYSSVVNDDSLQIVILDENDTAIVPTTNANSSAQALRQILFENDGDIRNRIAQAGTGYITINFGFKKYNVSYLSQGTDGWKYVSIMPSNVAGTENKSFVIFTLLLLIVDGIVFFVSSFVISKNTITPIQQLLQSMKNVDEGRFIEVKLHPQNYEFEQLFLGYNKMIRQINKLLNKTLEEQKTIRKAELNTLKAQIKPHFLYNTLDSIASLALSGDSKEVCNLVEALGNYYRASVSKGREVISVGEEIDMVRNYLNIQKVRYQDMFEVRYDVDDECLEYPILKLVLQPLVENALYHGIREKGTSGVITVSAQDDGEAVVLVVADDGIGMSREKIDHILSQEKNSHSESFGLWGTMERIRIFYGRDDCFHLKSELGKGTQITLRIPKGGDINGKTESTDC